MLSLGNQMVARLISDFHLLIFAIGVTVGIVVFGLMVYSLMQHRRPSHRETVPFHASPFVELIWTLIPLVMVVGMTVLATRTLLLREETSVEEASIRAPEPDAVDAPPGPNPDMAPSSGAAVSEESSSL